MTRMRVFSSAMAARLREFRQATKRGVTNCYTGAAGRLYHLGGENPGARPGACGVDPQRARPARSGQAVRAPAAAAPDEGGGPPAHAPGHARGVPRPPAAPRAAAADVARAARDAPAMPATRAPT